MSQLSSLPYHKHWRFPFLSFLTQPTPVSQTFKTPTRFPPQFVPFLFLPPSSRAGSVSQPFNIRLGLLPGSPCNQSALAAGVRNASDPNALQPSARHQTFRAPGGIGSLAVTCEAVRHTPGKRRMSGKRKLERPLRNVNGGEENG